jgi:hypothetical protein
MVKKVIHIADIEEIKKLIKIKAVTYADNTKPNSPNNMVDEYEWQLNYKSFKDGAESIINDLTIDN